MNPTRMHAIMSGEDRSLSAKLLRVALSCAAPLYRAGVACRNAIFDCGLRKPVKLARPVISVGNITTGGTGKTPMVMHLARSLLAMGAKPGILTRGYRGGAKEGGEEKTSDEVELFRAEFGEAVPVEVNADRVAGAKSMLEKHGEISVFLLDDGFQRRQVHRDLDIVLIDATQPFGHGRLLPRGLLREPVRNLRRADVIIITRCNEVSAAELDDVTAQLRSASSCTIIHAAQSWRELRQGEGDRVPVADLRDLPIFAFTGIGNPSAFEQMLRRHADQVRGIRALPDHHAFSQAQVRALMDEAKASGAQAIVTTEKDWMKLRSIVDGSAVSLPLLRPVLDISFPHQAEWAALEAKMKACLAR